MFVTGIKPAGGEPSVRRKTPAQIGIPQDEVLVKFVVPRCDGNTRDLEWLGKVFERRIPPQFDFRPILKINLVMKISVLGLYAAGCVENIIDLPMRTHVAEKPAPSPGAPRVGRDTCKSLNADAWYEAHFIVIVLLDDRVSTAELPCLVQVLHRHPRRQIFA